MLKSSRCDALSSVGVNQEIFYFLIRLGNSLEKIILVASGQGRREILWRPRQERKLRLLPLSLLHPPLPPVPLNHHPFSISSDVLSPSDSFSVAPAPLHFTPSATPLQKTEKIA